MKTKITSIRLKMETFGRMKKYCGDKGAKQSDLVDDAVRLHLDRLAGKDDEAKLIADITKRLDRLEAVTNGRDGAA